MGKRIDVIKASGRKEPFSEEKLRGSIRRAGVPRELEDQAASHIRRLLYEGIPTRKIYENILKFLGESSYPQGKARYSLKQAIMDLGPSGYPFEKFLAEVFKVRGYSVLTGVVARGKCARHEIDIVAEKDKERFLVECKFHNRPGIKTDIKIALYVKARFDDVMMALEEKPAGRLSFNQAWLATNTKFTSQATRYCECAGLRLLGWNYPQGDSLREWVEKSGLQPLTCLFSLSKSQKDRLLEQGIVLCRDLVKGKKEILGSVGLSSDLIKKTQQEAQLVCQLA